MPTCTYCKGSRFYSGPSGGMSVNILCANAECRHWFNWTEALGELDDLNRIEPTEDQRRVAIEEQERKDADAAKAHRSEGMAFYAAGKPAQDCIDGPSYGSAHSRARADIERLCGYINAMREDRERGPRDK